MSTFILGGWTQNPNDVPPSSFSYSMYGMVTNLSSLTTGTPLSPGWSPLTTSAPKAQGKVMWTYGGGGCTPNNLPNSNAEVADIVRATQAHNWAGVDFDDECCMNIDYVIDAMKSLSVEGKETSYTFLAGWEYNNPGQSTAGVQINHAVQKISNSGYAKRFVLMAYGSAMWSMQDIQANVGSAIQRTIDNGVSPSRIVLALTPHGLNAENLAYFLDQVTHYDIAGLFVWDFTALSNDDLLKIESKLGIS